MSDKPVAERLQIKGDRRLAVIGATAALEKTVGAAKARAEAAKADVVLLFAADRCITEMGMGVDVHGKDATKAARRAVSDAIRHSSLSFVRLFGKTPDDMFVDVMIAVPNPDGVDTAAVARELPYGTVTVTAVKGGLEIPAEQGGDSILIANAAVIVSLDDGK